MHLCKTKRRNHFVPRMLLKNFTDKDGKLYFFDRRFEEKRILKTTLDALYRERDLYVVRDKSGNRDDSAEERFAKFERKAANVKFAAAKPMYGSVRASGWDSPDLPNFIFFAS